jgi:hypothetical protein
MSKVFRYATAYGLWILGIGLAFWLLYLSILALFYEQGEWQYTKTVNLVDRIITVTLGLGWLVYTIVTEDKYRKGALKGDLLKSFARFTGPVLVSIFVVDLILFWLGGVGSDNLLRWLILAAELGGGIALVVYGKIKPAIKSN